MKSKTKFVLGLGSILVAPLSLVSIVSCEYTIDQRINGAVEKLGDSAYIESSKNNWRAANDAVNKNNEPILDAIDVYERIKNSENKSEEIFKYMKIPNESPLSNIGTGKIEVVKYELDSSNWKDTAESRLKIEFKVKKGNKLSKSQFVYAKGFKSIQSRNRSLVDEQIQLLNETKIEANKNNNIYIHDLTTAEQLSKHVIGLPDYFVPKELPQLNVVSDDKIRLWVLEFKNLRDSIEPNTSASIDVRFQIIKGNVVKEFTRRIDGFISTGDDSIDNQFAWLSPSNFNVNSRNNIYIKNLTNQNINQHVIGLPDYFVSGDVPQNLDPNNSKIRLYVSRIVIRDSNKPNETASAVVTFELIKGSEKKIFEKTITGFISSGQTN